MKDFNRNKGVNQEVDALWNPEVRHSLIRSVIREQMTGTILTMIQELFEEEVRALSGNRYSRKGRQYCYRGGSEPASVYMEGHKIKLCRPRLRRNGREAPLDTYKQLRSFDLMSRELLPLLIHGIATRNYGEVVGKIHDGTMLSRSTLSRAFIRASRKDLDEINGRDLSGYRLIAMFLDGIVFGGVHLIVALGVTEAGKKVILGLWEGASENARVCGELLSMLRERGLKVERRILIVMDGSKALGKAVEEYWGDQQVTQRCHEHKIRNVPIH